MRPNPDSCNKASRRSPGDRVIDELSDPEDRIAGNVVSAVDEDQHFAAVSGTLGEVPVDLVGEGVHCPVEGRVDQCELGPGVRCQGQRAFERAQDMGRGNRDIHRGQAKIEAAVLGEEGPVTSDAARVVTMKTRCSVSPSSAWAGTDGLAMPTRSKALPQVGRIPSNRMAAHRRLLPVRTARSRRMPPFFHSSPILRCRGLRGRVRDTAPRSFSRSHACARPRAWRCRPRSVAAGPP